MGHTVTGLANRGCEVLHRQARGAGLRGYEGRQRRGPAGVFVATGAAISSIELPELRAAGRGLHPEDDQPGIAVGYWPWA